MLNFILYGLSIVAQLVLCFLVYYATIYGEKDSQKLLVKRFYFLGASTVLWSLSQSAYDWSNNLEFQGIVLRIGVIATVLTGLSFLTFVFTLIGKSKLGKEKFYYPLALAALVGAVYLDFFSISLDSNGSILYDYNFLQYGLLTLIPIILVARSVVKLITARFKAKNDINKRQYTALLHGMLISATIALAGNFIIPYFWDDGRLNSILVAFTPVVFTSSIVYSVFSLKLFNFRKFFTNILVYGLIFTGSYTFSFLAVSLLADLYSISQAALIGILLPISLVIFILSSKLASKVVGLLTKSNNEGYTLDQIAPAMRTISSSRLLEDTSEIIRKTLGLNRCAFIFFTKEGKKLWYETGKSSSKPMSEETFSKFINNLTDDFNIVYKGSLEVNFSAAIPIKRQGIKGALLLGEKLSGRPIYLDEQTELKKAAYEVALGVENTLQYEKIKQFNLELEGRIEDATSKLRKTNDKLKALDEAKDEFISMASHQLRTPLTSIKGYISLILDGDMGKVPTKQRRMLQEAFSSSQRMVYLISDLLNVSRLKTGKFLIEPVDLFLPDVVEEEIDQVNEMADVKNIKIIYSKPKTLTHIELDDMKIRQVIMNFIDNAIHYTPEGGEITVLLSESEKSIEFKVVDSGIGVPKAEQHHLFTKFYRAGNARKARPDGTGLGLFMAKKVIVASGGSIIFSSEEGKGSTFGFIFPKKKAS